MSQKLFIIHGWTYSLDKWQALEGSLKSLGLEPVLLKVPGLTAPSNKVWDINGYVDWLDKQLEGATKPIVIGHSNGGRISLAFVQKYPERLSRLILIDSAGVPHDSVPLRIKLQILKVIAKLAKVFIRGTYPKKVFYKLIGAQDYFNAPPNMKLTMQNMLAADKTIDPSTIQLPTTIIWGRNDTITPLADGHKLNSSIAGSKLYVIDDARHAPFFNKPKEVAELILRAVK